MNNQIKFDQLSAIMDVLKLAEKLKFELRHSWLSNGRQESVAEHTWRMSLMAILIEPLLDEKVDLARLLKMIIIHDLVEAEAGDVSVLDQIRDPEIKNIKQQNEEKAILNIRDMLATSSDLEIYDLFYEFEKKKTFEAKVANAIDKLEVQLQHNHADISTWEEIEYDLSFVIGKHVQFDQTFILLKDLIEKQASEKLKEAGLNVEEIRNRAISTFS
ncbi:MULTISPECIES: HD domain-containing protein [unclassified Sphingobacterium]|uniref:HD domain-containing protein n=1 Tax=unclassified Sphingobacterium TaxID=2609468 RepID=UPI00295548EA|nr:HD domain-containing protein [Sphingobacterium sp. UGAL515B_05]WON93588.1 HD domain-containing protein [Sphingobacterium sp. UGAL515B_05]